MRWVAVIVVAALGGGLWWAIKANNEAEAGLDRSDLPPIPAAPPEPDYAKELEHVDAKLRKMLIEVMDYRLENGGKPIADVRKWDDLKLPDPSWLYDQIKDHHSHLAKNARRTSESFMPAVMLTWGHLPHAGKPKMDWVRSQGDRLPIAIISESALGYAVPPTGPQRYRLIRLDGMIEWYIDDPSKPENAFFPTIPGTQPPEQPAAKNRELKFGRR